jgi:hypothetical protein
VSVVAAGRFLFLPYTIGDVSEKSDVKEKQITKTVQDLNSQSHTREFAKEMVFAVAIDHKQHTTRQESNEKIVALVEKVIDDQPDWITERLENNELPNGFVESAQSGGTVNFDLSDKRLDHEYVMHPADDFVVGFASEYYEVVCGEYSLQKVTEVTRQRDRASDAAIFLMSQIGGGSVLLPLMVIYSYWQLEENIDKVCEKAEPY